MPDEMTDAFALLFTQAQSQLQQQLADLAGLRNRATAMLSSVSIVAGIFAFRVPKDSLRGPDKISVTVALITFAVSVILTLAISAPRKRWLFTFRLDELADLVSEGKATPVDITQNLTRWSEDARRMNAERLSRLYLLFGVLCVAVGVQVVAWCLVSF